MSVTKYRIYCITEDAFVETWGVEAPTKCPNDGSHPVRENSLQELETISNNMVRIVEEEIKTGGRHMCEGISFEAKENGISYYDWSCPIPINMIRGWTQSGTENRGDVFTVCMHPDTLIGQTTSSNVLGSNEIYVTNTVLAYSYLGLYLKIQNPLNGNCTNLGRIIEIDNANSKIITEKKTSYTFPSSSIILMTKFFIMDYEFGWEGQHIISSSRQVGAYIPPGTIMRFKYENKSVSDVKKICFYIEYLY